MYQWCIRAEIYKWVILLSYFNKIIYLKAKTFTPMQHEIDFIW